MPELAVQPGSLPPASGRWRGLGAFLVIVAGLFGGLRVAHLVLPSAEPPPIARILDLGEDRAGLGVSAIPAVEAGDVPIRLPFYRPKSLGSDPVFAAVVEQPVVRFLGLWRSDRILVLELWASPERWGVPSDALAWAGAEGAVAWRRGEIFCVVAPDDGAVVRLCTDLAEVEARRILRSLRPLDQRR